ncbi:MAG: glycosyltransferase family 39 protein, partial [Cyanobacteria bacterium J06638_22]
MQRPSYSPSRLAYFSKHSLQILCLVVILLGIFFRFYNLDKKVFWHDETYTAIAVSGYERDDARRDLILSLGLSTEELQDYQTIDSDDTTWEDTLESVAEEEPQNSPLYFLLSRFWVQLTQTSVDSGMRLLSAVISLLTFPAAFWLCWELFQSVQVAWLGTALIGISPIHLLYAQEARQYSLLTVATLVASALLLRVTQQRNPYLSLLNWLIYAILCTLGLYTQPFFLFVMVGHGVYILFQKPFRFKTLLSYSLASILSVLVYAPWLYIILTDLEAISGWRGDTELSFSGLIGRWLLNLSRIFADFYAGDLQNYDLIFSLINPLLYLVLALLLLVG